MWSYNQFELVPLNRFITQSRGIHILGNNYSSLIHFISRRNLTLKAPITTASNILIFFFFSFFNFSRKTGLDISCESSAWQTIHMKYQDLFSLKNKKKIKIIVVCNKVCLALSGLNREEKFSFELWLFCSLAQSPFLVFVWSWSQNKIKSE